MCAAGRPPARRGGPGGLCYTPDPRGLPGVAGRNRQQFVAVDGGESPPVDVVAAASFAPDSSKVAAAAVMGGQRWLFLDDRRVGPGTFYAFAPGGATLGHAVPSDLPGKFTLAIDGQPVGPELDASPPGARLVWESPTVVRTVAGRGAEMYLVRLDLRP